MASRKIRDEVMMMTISVNSDPAQQAIYELRKENVKYAETIADLEKKKDSLGRRNKANAQEWDDLTSKIKENKEAINNNKDRMEELRRSMDLSQMTMSQLKKEAELLKRQLNEVVPGSATAKQYEERLQAVKARMAEVNVGAKQTSLSFANLADRFNQYSGLVAGIVAVLVGFGVAVQNIIDRNNKMADAISGVEKSVGMTKKEVEDLTRSFSDLDTRSSKMDLLAIATGGGRLGVAKGEIRDFVEVADKAITALGDSWQQSPDKIAESMGKVATLYKQTRDLPIAESINQVGSALNELAAAGAASEQNINDFTTRVGALPEKLKPTIADAMGLGAAFEESGIEAERAGTAYTTFVKTASNNAEKFAKVMQVPVDKVKEMINTNPTEFFLQFSEKLKGLDATDLAKTLDYLKINDQYVTAIVGSASEKTQRFREVLELSNTSMREATSLTDEFNKVNNNAAGVYEKLSKKISAAFTSKTVADFINTSVRLFGQFMGVVEDAEGYVTGFRSALVFLLKMIVVGTAAFVSTNLVIAIYNGLLVTAIEKVAALTIVEKARNAVMTASKAISNLYIVTLSLMQMGYARLTGNIGLALKSQIAFNVAIKQNPVGMIVTLVTAAAGAYMLYKSSVKESYDVQKKLNDVTKEGINNAAEDIAKLDNLYRSATNAALGKDKQREAAEKLQRLYPETFKNISTEIIMNGKARDSYMDLRNSIIAAAKAKAAQAEIDKVSAEYFKKEMEIKAKMQKANENYRNAGTTQQVTLGSNGGVTYQSKDQNKELYKNEFEGHTKELEAMVKERNAVLGKLTKYVDINGGVKGSGSKDGGNTGGGAWVPGDDDDKNKTEKSKQKELEKQQREQERHEREMDMYRKQGDDAKALSVQIELDKEDAVIAAMNEGYDKEIDTINLQEQRKLAEIDKKKVTQNQFDAVDRKIATAKGDDKQLFEALKQSWIDNNNELEKLKAAQTAVFDQKRKQLRIQSENEWLKDQEESYQIEVGRFKRQMNEELAQYQSLAELKQGLQGRVSDIELRNIKTWEEGKEALTKVYQQKEIDLHVAHLQEMVKLYEGLDLSILNKDQQEQVLKFIEDAKNSIAELKAKQNDNNQSGKQKGKKGKNSLGNSSTDVLGLSPEDWDTMFVNLQKGTDALGTMQAAVGALKEAFSTYYSFVQAQEEAQTAKIEREAEKKEAKLKKMLDNGQLNQEQYEAEVQRLNEETDKKKAKIEYESAVRQRNIQIAQIIANTAQAIMSIWAQVPKFDFGATATIMTGIVSALGALQVATVLKTPLPEAPGAEDGYGYGDNYDIRRSQDGKIFNVKRKKLRSGEVSSPTHFIAGENDRVEMVIANSDYKRFSPKLKKAINSELASSRGYEGGYYPYLSRDKESDSEKNELKKLIKENTAAMNKVATMEPRAYLAKDMRTAKEILEITEEYNGYKKSSEK